MTRHIALTAAAALWCGTALAQDTHPETGEALAEDQSFAYRMLDDWKTIDPALISETAGNHAARQLFEGLYNSDPSGQPEPGVALSHEVSEDGLTYTFTLRDDARWSNGDPVTAGDFEYAIKRAVDPETASEYSWYIELATLANASEVIAGEAEPDTLGVRAIDDTTLEFTLEEALPFFPSMVTFATFFPVHQATVEEHGADWTDPENLVGNGAYTLTSYRPGERWTAEKSDTYWDAENVIVDEITGLIINDEQQALVRYFDDEVDMVEPLPPGQFPQLEEEYPEQAHSIPRLCSYYYALNQTEDGPEALRDPNVRRALSLAVDRDVIVDQILQGGQTPAYTFAHKATAGFETPQVDIAGMSQADRDAEAKRLFEEAGSPELDLDLIYNTSDNHRAIATVVSQMWKQKLGVETNLSNYEWATYLDVRGQQNFDVARSAWCADYNEASSFLAILETGNEYNDGKYSNAEVDQLIQASGTAENPQENYTRIEEILSEETAIIPIYHYALVFMLKEDVRGWPFENAENNWYARDFYRVAETD